VAPIDIPPTNRPSLPILTAVVVWPAAIYIAATTAYWSWRAFHPVPFWDGLAPFIDLGNGQPVTLRWLWSQHNEHRFFLPRLVTVADNQFFHGRGHLGIFLIWSMLIASTLLMTSLSFDVIGRSASRRPWRILMSSFIVVLMYSSMAMENFYLPIETGFMGMVFFTLLAFYCFTRSYEALHPRLWMAAAALAAMASSLGLIAGLITVVMLNAACWFARVPRRVRIVLGMVSAAFIAAYLYDYRLPSDQGAPIEALEHHQLTVVKYLLAYVGDPLRMPALSRWFLSTTQAAFTGAVGITLFGIALYFMLFVSSREPAAGVASGSSIICGIGNVRLEAGSLALFSVSLVVFAEGFASALARYHLGIGQALASRYVSVVSMFWISIASLIVRLMLGVRPAPMRLQTMFCLAMVVAVAGLAFQNVGDARDAAKRVIPMELDSNAMLVGVSDTEVLRVLFPRPNEVEAARQYLLRNRLSIFADDRYTWIGRKLTDLAQVSGPDTCRGAIETVSHASVQGGALVSGWAWAEREHHAPEQIVMVDDRGVIVGLASGGIERHDVAAAAIDDAGWQGFAREAHNISAYVLSNKDRLACKLAGTFEVSAERAGFRR
jgi:hypothetical protein